MLYWKALVMKKIYEHRTAWYWVCPLSTCLLIRASFLLTFQMLLYYHSQLLWSDDPRRWEWEPRSIFLHHHFPRHLATNRTFFSRSPSQRGKELGFWLDCHVFSHEIQPLMKTRDDFGSRWLEKHWFSEAITTIPRVLNVVWDTCPTSSWCFYSLCTQLPLFKVVLAEARMLLYLAQKHSALFLLWINYFTYRLWVLCVHLCLYNNHLEVCISTKRLKKISPQTNENLFLSLSLRWMKPLQLPYTSWDLITTFN